MRASSFRWKLAATTTGICAAVLLLFGTVMWNHHVRVGQARLDHELMRLTEHHLEHFFNEEEDEHDGEREEDRLLPSLFLGEDMQDVEVLVLDAEGRTRFRSPDLGEPLLSVLTKAAGSEPRREAALEAVQQSGAELAGANEDWELGAVTTREDVSAGGRSWRVCTVVLPDRGQLAVALDLSHYQAAQLHFLVFGLGILAIALFLAGLAAWWMAHRALRPVLALTRSMEEITVDSLEDRLSVQAGAPEFRRMIQVFNGMLERLQRSFEQAARFSADASHEMKTPLTIMQGQIETALSSVPDGSEAQQALATQLEELHRLKGLVEKLLLLSRMDSGRLPILDEVVDLSALSHALCEDLEILAQELQVECRIEEGLLVRGDPGLLQNLLQNLGSNAAKYNREQGWIRIELVRERQEVVLQVCNSGGTLQPAQAEKVFDRFMRADSSRNRTIEGLGLGLSLAREIARAHGGTLGWMPGQDEGNCFLLRLPRQLS